MGLFSDIAGIIGGAKQAKASKKASQLQYQASQDAIAEQRRQFDTTREDFQPFLDTGTAALGGYGDLLGLNGDETQAGAVDALRASPLFQSLYDTGEEAILANASATGGLRGGNTNNSLARFGRDTLADVIQRQLSNLGGLISTGSGAAGSVGQFGANASQNIGNYLTQGAQAQSSGILNSARLKAQNLQTGAGAFENILGSFFGGGGF